MVRLGRIMAEETRELEIVGAESLQAITKGEIESQIEVAKRFPRSLETFKRKAIEMATIDEETAASCIYHRPVGKEAGVMKYADGMSIRMAEIVGCCYGNLRVGSMLIEQTERQVKARGAAIDLESNYASSCENVEATVTQDGKPYSERMRIVTAKATLAKARRDATFSVVPRALAKPIESAVRKLLLGDAKSIEQRRSSIVGWIQTLGIAADRVWAALGVKGLADVGIMEMEVLTGLRTAIKDGEASIDETFPAPEIKTPQAVAPTPTSTSAPSASIPQVAPTVPSDKRTPTPAKRHPGRPSNAERAAEAAAQAAETPIAASTAPEPTQKVETQPIPPEPAVAKPSAAERPDDDDDSKLSQAELIDKYKLWIDNCTPEELFGEPNWLLQRIALIKATSDKVKVLAPFNTRRRALAGVH